MQYDVIFKVGELCKWRCMVAEECRDPKAGITAAKWYDANVHQTFGSAMTLYIVNDRGVPMPVPHYAKGLWEGFTQIGIIAPELAEARMRDHIQKQINNQKAQHQTAMNNLRHEMRSINIKGFVDESVIPVEANA